MPVSGCECQCVPVSVSASECECQRVSSCILLDVPVCSGVQKTVGTPVLVGSGVTNLNLADYATADALIVGSHFKVAGHWSNDLDTGRLRQFMTAVHLVRRNAS